MSDPLVSHKNGYGIFLKLNMKVEDSSGKKVMRSDFHRKIRIW